MEDSNGKVTMAVLANKIDNLTEQIRELTKSLILMQENRVAIATLRTELHNQCGDIDSLEKKVNELGVFNSAIAILAAFLGIFVNPPK